MHVYHAVKCTTLLYIFSYLEQRLESLRRDKVDGAVGGWTNRCSLRPRPEYTMHVTAG